MKQAETIPAQPEPQEKRKRQITALPVALEDGTVINDLSLDELVQKKWAYEAELAGYERKERELVAIRAAIRAKA